MFHRNSQRSTNRPETRPSYRLGNCKDLRGDLYVISLFLDDKESKWDDRSRKKFWKDEVQLGFHFLEKNAAHYRVPLSFEHGSFYTGASGSRRMYYDGIVVKDPTQYWNYSINYLKNIALALGFPSEEAFHEAMQYLAKGKEIIYLIFLNKQGRSYAVPDQANDNKDKLEYSIIFRDYTGYPNLNSATTIAHEILHLFGAEDYYNPYGKYPKRAALAEKLCPNDIMFRDYCNVFRNTVGPFTAYSVGWLNSLPKEYDVDDWWR